MKTQNSRAPIPHKGKQSQHSISQQVIVSSWDDQPDLSDEPEFPELEVNWDEIPEPSDDLIERAISFLLKYWTEQPKSDGKPGLNDEERHLEINRLLSEQMLLHFLASERINESLERIRSHQINIELELGHEFSLHSICILVELLENAKRDLEKALTENVTIFKNNFTVSDKKAFSNYSSLLHLLPQLYQVKEFISLPSILNTAEAVELAHFLFYGGCFKKSAGIAKVRKDLAQMFGINTSELTLNAIAYSNKNDRQPLLLIKKLKRNWDIKHYGCPGASKID